MNGKKSRALRAIAGSSRDYQALKRAESADQGQRPKLLAARWRKPKLAIKATWPATADQRAQQRPLIVLHPARQLGFEKGNERQQELRDACNALPKWMCDAAAVRGYL